jgi:hypothetical protein
MPDVHEKPGEVSFPALLLLATVICSIAGVLGLPLTYLLVWLCDRFL